MKTSWPYFPIDQQLPPHFLPTPDKIVISYFPMTGGHFLARVLSCSDDLYGEEFFYKLGANYKTKFEIDPNKNQYAWRKAYEGKYHPNLTTLHPRFLTFDQWMKIEKLIFVDIQFTEKETNWLLFRRNFVGSSAQHDQLADVQIKYEKELLRFLENNKKIFYKFPHAAFLKKQYFSDQINNCLDWLNLKTLDEKMIHEVWTVWWKLNHRLGGKQKTMKPLHIVDWNDE